MDKKEFFYLLLIAGLIIGFLGVMAYRESKINDYWRAKVQVIGELENCDVNKYLFPAYKELTNKTSPDFFINDFNNLKEV